MLIVRPSESLLPSSPCVLSSSSHISMFLAAQEMERLVGIDLDPTAHDIAKTRIKEAVSGRTTSLSTDFYRGNYWWVVQAFLQPDVIFQ